MDSMDTSDCSPFEQEDQFILRVPVEDAQTIRNIINSKRNKSKIKLDLDIGNNSGLVFLGDKVLEGNFKKLPTVVESYKTNLNGNKSNMFKTADISHILDCTDGGKPEVDENVDPNTGVSKKKKKKGDEEKMMDAPDGLTPPMKSARRRRFRKTLYNNDTACEVDNISKELYYLVSTDMQAVSTRFEVIYETPTTTTLKQPLQAKDLFGEISSDEPEEEK